MTSPNPFTHWLLPASLALAGALLGGCASLPPTRFHTLLPADTAGAAFPASGSATDSPLYIELVPVTVPAQVDHQQWVVRATDDSLLMLEQERWAAPLRDELRSALADRLAARWRATGAHVAADPAAVVWRIRVDVDRFESMPGRGARLDSTWSVSSSQRGASTLTCRGSIRESVTDANALALAAGHRRAVMRLADEIGQRLQALQRGESVACIAAARDNVTRMLD